MLEEEFGRLLHTMGWELLRKNYQNNHTEEEEDIAQELRLSMLRAGSYYKRQIYIESCFNVVEKYAKGMNVDILNELKSLWKDRTRHGANRQKFGPYQEDMLFQLVKKVVPKNLQPDPQKPLTVDTKFSTYCKAIAWNAQKNIGKKITKEKFWRSGQVSISEFDYLGST